MNNWLFEYTNLKNSTDKNDFIRSVYEKNLYKDLEKRAKKTLSPTKLHDK